MRPSMMAKVIESGEFDAILPILDFAERFIYNFEEKVLSFAQKHNVGVVAMKAMGRPKRCYGEPNMEKLGDYAEFAARYALSILSVAYAVTGILAVDELDVIGKGIAQKLGAKYGDLS